MKIKNKSLKYFSPLAFGFLLGCSSLQSMLETSSARREFQLRKVWVRQGLEKDNLAFRKINRMKPLISDDLLITANAIDGVVAYQKDSGQEVWRLPVLNGVEASAALIKDRLFFGASDGQFYAVNSKTGNILWTFPTRVETLAEPLLEEGVLYFQTGNGTLYAVDAATGKQLWLYSRQETSSLSIRGGSKPAFRNGTLYVGFSDGVIVALIAKNGAVKWEKQLSKNKKFRDLDTDPVIVGDDLYLVGFDDAAYCLRAATGDTVWKTEKGGYGAPLVTGDSVYFASSNGEFVSLNRSSGQRQWAFTIKNGVATAGSLYKGMIVFGESQGRLLFVDAKSGKLISSFEPGRGLFSQPLADEKNSMVYFISSEANVYAIEAKWGVPPRFDHLQ